MPAGAGHPKVCPFGPSERGGRPPASAGMEAEDRAGAWLQARYHAWMGEGHELLEAVRGLPDGEEPELVAAVLAHDDALGTVAGGAGPWTFHGLVFGKQADHDLLGALADVPSSTRRDAVAALVRARLEVSDVVERMWALYDRLAGLAAQHEPLDRDEAGTYVAWLGELGVDGGEVTVAAADLGVAVLEHRA